MRTRWIKHIIYFGTGSALYALSVSSFSTPNDIAAGGATGLAVLLNALSGAPVGLTVMLVNVPLFIAAFVSLSRSYALASLAVLTVSSVLIDVFAAIVPPFVGDPLSAALGGGLLAGAGIGLIMTHGAGTGGSEIAASLIQKRVPHLSVGRLILLVDAAVVLLSIPVFGSLAAALYAAVQVFVSSTVIDRIVYGREEGCLLLVITSKAAALCEAVTVKMARGVTAVQAVGGYSGEDRTLLLCAVSRLELVRLRRLVREVDGDAFAMVLTTKQVFGEGFLSDNA